MASLLIVIIYICFISLGLPDSLLGSAWPTMFQQFDVPISYAGLVSMIISCGTIFSSLQSDRLTKKLGVKYVVLFSVILTSLSLLGFSLANKFWMLLILAIPYGLGAGSIDAALNNYVAIHYKSHHMSWLHCMWGLGASISPYVMGYALTYNDSWNKGYLYVAIIQAVIAFIVLISLPLWKKTIFKAENEISKEKIKPLGIKDVFKIKGTKTVMITFFCYCALESTAMLWASSYLVLHNNMDETLAASLASLLFIGITVGRAISGFLTFKISDKNLIRIGSAIILIGVLALTIFKNNTLSVICLIAIGLGCAPIYPCIIHSTPIMFGKDKSQAIIGVQMASAYVGSCLMPPLFGLIANHISVSLYPVYILILLVLMIVMHEVLVKITKGE